MNRIDANRIALEGPVPATVFANERVPVEAAAVTELRELLALADTAEAMWRVDPGAFTVRPGIERVALSPDFHKGAGIPIGTSLLTRGFCVPQAVGNDVNCGVRLHRTSLDRDAVAGALDRLEPLLRHIFFEGGRSIPLTQAQRVALLRNGLEGLLAETPPADGIWATLDRAQADRDLARTKHRGRLPTDGIFGLEDYVGREGVTRDSQIGSVGGGNHFVEIQWVSKVHQGAAAHAWGLTPGKIVVMAHSGSVNVGHLSGGYFMDLVRERFPKTLAHPANGIFPLPDNTPAFPRFFSALHNAAHFAWANRFFLALMARQAFLEVVGDHDFALVYDTPHNLAWLEADGSVLHRKGASPAAGIGLACDPWFGEPVLVPGSMGAPSLVLEGLGSEEALGSASHGAGRKLTRGAAAHREDAELDAFLREFRVVTPLDPRRQDVRGRRDILGKWRQHLKEEAPWAYKDVRPVIETLEGAGIARPVAELRPLLTIKG
jgi:tRNA-splicing ligase RtcB